MATNAPDPRSFKDWGEAFQHPIPSIRKFEQLLRSHADENRQKLRTIVGGSYRDLLGTADRIVEMDEQMKQVELNLGFMGRQCNSKAVDRLFVNTAKFNASVLSRSEAQFSLASQLAMLQNCLSVLSSLLKRGGSLLLASKVCVLSRLTHKILSQSGPESQLIESLWSRLESLRRKLLSIIDQRICDHEAELSVLVSDMCAYSLATSATPTDILKYFHRARLKAIESALGSDLSSNGPTTAVQLLIRTLKVSQAIFPKRLSDALARLKDTPMLLQKDITSLADLDLDLHGQWIAEELRNYTPWPRHDELQKADAEKQLKLWTKRAFSTLMKGLESHLSQIDGFTDVLSTRREIFQNWPWSGTRLPTLDTVEAIDELRELLNDRLRHIIRVRVESLFKVTEALSKALQQLTADYESSSSLWDPGLVSMDAQNGATAFKLKVKAAYEGNEPVLSIIIQKFVSWTSEIKPLVSAIKSMRDDQWDDDLGDDIDETDGDSRQVLLSKDDPRSLETALSEDLIRAIKRFQGDTESTISNALEEEVEETLARSLVCLRFIREVSQQPVVKMSGQTALSLQFNASMISHIQSKLVGFASSPAISTFESSLAAFTNADRISGKLLWDGSPTLPTQPSPLVFQFLYKLTERMSSIGLDLWSTDTVLVLKRVCFEKIMALIQQHVHRLSQRQAASPAINGHESPVGNTSGSETDNPGSDLETRDDPGVEKDIDDSRAKDMATQLLFDTFYLHWSLGSDITSGVFGSVSSTLTGLGELGDSGISRLKRGSREYWKRTYLIFALLCT